jgi:putative transposase
MRREQVAFARERGLSQRRACELLEVSRSTLSYKLVRAERDAPAIEAMKRLAAQYPRYGYRRIRIFLRREGLHMSRHRAHRLWRLAELQLPRRRKRRRVASSRPRPLPAIGANYLWAYDFLFDACANGQSLKCLTIIDEFTRECLAIDVAGSIRSQRVIEVLARLISERGAPRYLRSDNVLNASAGASNGNRHPHRCADAHRHPETSKTASTSGLPRSIEGALPDHSGHKIQRAQRVIFTVPKTA